MWTKRSAGVLLSALATGGLGGAAGAAGDGVGVGPSDACLLRGEVAIELEATALDRLDAGHAPHQSKLAIYRDGRFCEVLGAEANVGRLSRDEARALVAALRRLPKPPDAHEACDARPLERVVLRGGGREVSFSYPCGEGVSRETFRLVERLRAATRLACLDREGTELLRWQTIDRDTLGPPIPRVEVTTLFESGRWTGAVSGAPTRRGCLSDAERERLGARLAKLEVATRLEDGTTCAGVPTRDVTVTAGGRTAKWSAPCTKTFPTRALDAFLAALSDAMAP